MRLPLFSNAALSSLTIAILWTAATSTSAAPATRPADLIGQWDGYLEESNDAKDTVMAMRFTFAQSKDGWTGTVYARRWGVTKWPLESVTVGEDGAVSFLIRAHDSGQAGAFRGHLYEGNLFGEYQWGETKFNALFGRKSREDLDKPPYRQLPTPPYPYHVEKVTFAGLEEQSGGLLLPDGRGPHAAVVLCRDSQPGTWGRDVPGSPEPNEYVWILSDRLARCGFAVLHVDSRGYGGTGGKYEDAGIVEIGEDVKSAVKYLVGRKDIDAKKIGLFGGSLGGSFAAIAAADNPDVAFVVHMSGQGLRGDLHKIERMRRAFEKTDYASHMPLVTEVLEHAFYLARGDTPNVESKVQLKEWYESNADALSQRHGVGAPPWNYLEPWIEDTFTPRGRTIARFDPAAYLKRIKTPILVVTGENDDRVPAKTNIPAIASALKEGGNTSAVIKVFPGLRHCCWPKGETEETIDEEALQFVTHWMAEQAGLHPATRAAEVKKKE